MVAIYYLVAPTLEQGSEGKNNSALVTFALLSLSPTIVIVMNYLC